jgi:hypothetical protein
VISGEDAARVADAAMFGDTDRQPSVTDIATVAVTATHALTLISRGIGESSNPVPSEPSHHWFIGRNRHRIPILMIERDDRFHRKSLPEQSKVDDLTVARQAHPHPSGSANARHATTAKHTPLH